MDYVFGAGESLERGTESFWQAGLADDAHPVVWATRTTACEYPGLLARAERAAARARSLIDLTEQTVARDDGSVFATPATGVIHPSELVRFLDTERPVSADDTACYRALWARLRAEGAMLRAVTPEGLISVPLCYFDADIVDCARSAWRPAARVIGGLLGRQRDAGYFQVGDLFLFARLRRLVADGSLAVEGDLRDMQQSRVRRMPAP